MSNAIVKKYSGVDFPEGKKLFRDQIMDEGFLGLFDFKSTYSTNGYTGLANSTFKSLTNDAATGFADQDTEIVNGGFVQKTGAQSVSLPDSFRMPEGVAGQQHFLFCQWIKMDTSAHYSANTPVPLGGFAYQLGSQNQYSIWGNGASDGSGGIDEIRFQANSYRIVSNNVTAMSDDLPHQLAVEFIALTSTTCRRIGYIDGVAVIQSNFTYDGKIIQPGASAECSLGNLGGFSKVTKATHYRAWLKDFEKSPDDTRTGAEIIAQEWELYKNRF
jgi:hypothetical protein